MNKLHAYQFKLRHVLHNKWPTLLTNVNVTKGGCFRIKMKETEQQNASCGSGLDPGQAGRGDSREGGLKL